MVCTETILHGILRNHLTSTKYSSPLTLASPGLHFSFILIYVQGERVICFPDSIVGSLVSVRSLEPTSLLPIVIDVRFIIFIFIIEFNISVNDLSVIIYKRTDFMTKNLTLFRLNEKRNINWFKIYVEQKMFGGRASRRDGVGDSNWQ